MGEEQIDCSVGNRMEFSFPPNLIRFYFIRISSQNSFLLTNLGHRENDLTELIGNWRYIYIATCNSRFSLANSIVLLFDDEFFVLKFNGLVALCAWWMQKNMHQTSIHPHTFESCSIVFIAFGFRWNNFTIH